MRIGGISALLVLITVGAAGADLGKEEPRYRLVIAFNTIEHLPTQEALAGPCLTDRPIYGCTRFGGRRLDCACENKDTGWQMTARAQFLTFIYLTQRGLLHHEQLHIDDVRRDAIRYLNELTSMTFESAERCEKAAQSASTSFAEQMETFQRRSNATRHPLDKPPVMASMGSKR